jgi:cytochrome c oxidase subunit 2
MPATLVVAVLGYGACSSGSPSMLDEHGQEARHVAAVWWLMFALAAGVYVIVAAFIFVALLRGRRTATGKPSRFKDDTFIWVGGIGVPVVILALLAVVTVTTTRVLRNPEPGELRIDVRGQRWWWDVRYPDSGVVTANEIHVPVGRQVDVALTSGDVVHSFWAPQLAGKLDLIPGQTNHLRFKALDAGVYRGMCAEYCGLQHADMDFLVVADAPADFDRWLLRRSTGAGTTAQSDEATKGQVVFTRESCAGCHTIRGTSAQGTVGPDLSDFGSRRTIGGATVPNTPDELAKWITNSQAIKPGNIMPPISLSPSDLQSVVTYLEGLK